jgi:hypothetical protein
LLELTFVGRSAGREQGWVAMHSTGKIGKQQRVGSGSALSQDVIIAGDFPLQGQLPPDPPDRGMKEKYGANQVLNQVRPIITPAHVSQLVAKNLLRFLRR